MANVDDLRGAYPIDFVIENLIQTGLDWFRNNPETAGNLVFGQLTSDHLSVRYGEEKVQELTKYILDHKIHIVQHFTQVHEKLPCFSIQILDSSEDDARAGLGDFIEEVDELDESGNLIGRKEIVFAPISDQIQIGIHAHEPDLVKYLYYFMIHILTVLTPELQQQGLQLTSFRATDLSRLNEWIPANVYSRFMNISAFSTPTFETGKLTIISDIKGVHAEPTEPGGLTLANIDQGD